MEIESKISHFYFGLLVSCQGHLVKPTKVQLELYEIWVI
jgi:hypothetical protein